MNTSAVAILSRRLAEGMSIGKHRTAIGSLILILICLGDPLRVYSQSEDGLENLKNVVPPSPNSSAFAQYGNWPVSLYTGIPNISIPVTALKGRTVEVPISLSYHAAGNHVGDVASWVGLGWSLSAGGVISRSVCGLNDEQGFFDHSSDYANPNDFSSVITPGIDYQRMVNTAKSKTDSEPDIYNFSAMGRSFRLLILADGTVKTIPHSNLKFVTNPIVGAGQYSDGWTVLLEDGTKLIFGGGGFTEYTNNFSFKSEDGQGMQFTSSWHLQSITSATGEVINFSYTSTDIEQDSYFSQSDFIKYLTNNEPCTPIEESEASKSSRSMQFVNVLEPSAIESDLFRIDFISTPDREDLYGGNALSEIKVFSKLANIYVERYVFNTTYTTAVSSNELLGGTTHTSYFKKRLKLNSFEKRAVGERSEFMRWTFDYNPQKLPSRRSYAQDHWGYFNGSTSNKTLLPSTYFQLPNSPLFESRINDTGFFPGRHESGADRDPDAAYMQAEILTGIHYPTGGYTKFDYEPNQVLKTKEVFTEKDKTLYLNVTSESANSESTKTTTFTITKPAYVKLSLSSYISESIDQVNLHVSGSILTSAGNPVVGKADHGTYWVNLVAAGTYTLKLSVNTLGSSLSEGELITGELEITYPLSGGVNQVPEFTGGLRIRSVKDYEKASADSTNVKYFVYETPLVINPVDVNTDYLTQQSSKSRNSATGLVCQYMSFIRNSSTKFASGSIQGGTTGYGKVTTLYGPNGENGKTVSEFTNFPDDEVDGPHNFPYPPSLSRDVRRGLLLSETQYRNDGTKLSNVQNTYEFTRVGKMVGFKAGYSERLDPFFCTDEFNNCGVQRSFYAIEAEQVKNTSSLQIVFDENGQNPDSLLTSNYYDNEINTRPVRAITEDSEGRTITTYMRTSLEKSDINAATPLSVDASAAIDAMIDQNMVSQPLQVEKHVDGQLVERTTTEYKTWSGNILLPANVQKQLGNNASFTTISIGDYDYYGNVIHIKPVDGVEKKYIWDYNSSHPIAEVLNARTASFAYTSFESDGNGNWNVSSSERDEVNSYTGTKGFALSSGYVQTYVSSAGKYQVSLWAKSGSNVLINSSAASVVASRNGWDLLTVAVTGSSTVTITGTGVIDEVRLTPEGAMMTTYAYTGFGGVSSVTDPSGATKFYEYDELLRLVVVRDDNNKVLTTYRYHYKNH
jgi:hypothetical protein